MKAMGKRRTAPVTSEPRKKTCLRRACKRRREILMRVDLPAPFSPSRATISPALRDMPTLLSARVPPNVFDTPRTSSRSPLPSGPSRDAICSPVSSPCKGPSSHYVPVCCDRSVAAGLVMHQARKSAFHPIQSALANRVELGRKTTAHSQSLFSFRWIERRELSKLVNLILGSVPGRPGKFAAFSAVVQGN